MINNVNQFIGSVAQTDLGKAARRSAKTIWNAHRAAFVTTRHEAGRVLGLAIDESQKLDLRSRKTVDNVVENLTGVAEQRLSSLEEAFQKRVNRVIRQIGLPTTREFEALSRRVDALSARVKPRASKKSPRRSTRRAA
jgi:poly(hydroxyalkanoate) granule-associated protein